MICLFRKLFKNEKKNECFCLEVILTVSLKQNTYLKELILGQLQKPFLSFRNYQIKSISYTHVLNSWLDVKGTTDIENNLEIHISVCYYLFRIQVYCHYSDHFVYLLSKCNTIWRVTLDTQEEESSAWNAQADKTDRIH